MKKQRLASAAPDRTIEQKQGWLTKQILPTLSQVWYALGGPGAEYFAELLDLGMERMTEAQWAQAETFRADLLKEIDLRRKKKQEIREIQKAAHSAQVARGIVSLSGGEIIVENKEELVWA